MNTNLPLVPQTSDGPTWSNGWAATSAHLDMIAKQYKNGTRTGKERGKNEKKGGKNRLERGPKRVLNGKKTESRQIRESRTAKNGRSSPFHIFLAVFWPFHLVFHPFFHDFGQKREKNGCPKMEERERKERVPFPFLSHSHFFPFLAWHISSSKSISKLPCGYYRLDVAKDLLKRKLFGIVAHGGICHK